MKLLSRRSLLYTVAASAGVAGAGWAWYRGGVTGNNDALPQAVWALNLELPEGGQLRLAAYQGRPIVLNFWATWCPPCIEELPLLDAFQRSNAAKRWQILGIAVDNAKAVQKFLTQTPLSFPTPLAGFAGVDLSKSLGNLNGGLPFTVVVNAAGDVAWRHMGKLTESQIDNIAKLI
jgi:thiol-disulfide isomerase/thioredoxin